MPPPARPRWGPVLFWPAVAAAAGLAGWAARRWGFRVAHVERERARVPRGPAVRAPEPPGAPPVQTPADGAGARFHRRYHVDIAPAALSPEELMARVTADLNAFTPREIARFEKTTGSPDRLAVGDDLVVRISSPWNGPVRVAEVTPTGFTLATLEGHLEAGLIRFSAAEAGEGAVRFTIESWARSADGVVDLFYDTLGVVKGGQAAMWTYFCDRVAAMAGQKRGDVVVLTEREADPDAASDEPSDASTADAAPAADRA